MRADAIRSRAALASPAGAVFCLALVGPAVMLVLMSFWRNAMPLPEVAFTLESFGAILKDPVYGVVLRKTLVIATTATLACLLIAYPVAYWLAFHVQRNKTVWLVVITLPFWTSYLLRIFSWRIILGFNGVINGSLQSAGLIDQPLDWLAFNNFSVVLALTHAWVTFAILPIFVTLDRLDPQLLEAARDLGYGSIGAFLRVTLPLSLPGIGAGAALIFIPIFGDYVTPRLLGGPDTMMIGVLIQSTFSRGQNWPLAAAISLYAILWIVVIVGFVVTAFAAASRVRSRG